MKKLAIALCLAIAFFVPAWGQDPCTQTTKLNANATGTRTWNGTVGATTVGGTGDDAYGVEAWTEAGGSATKLTWFGSQGGGYAIRAEWTNSTDYLGRFGYFWGNNGKKWNALGDLCVDYNYTRSANGTGGSYSYIGIYGWTIGSGNNVAEYYIVEDWFGANQQTAGNLGSGCQTHGNITVDGKTYEVVTCIRPAGSGCVGCGNQAFGQVFSIRQGMRNPEPAKCGTISIKKHFEEWVKMTTQKNNQSPAQYIYDKTYESKFLVEAQGGTGWYEASYTKFSRTGGCGVQIPAGNVTLTTTASPAAGGSITKSPNATSYTKNASVQLTATPNTGWKFDGWTITSADGGLPTIGAGADNPTSITMDANKNVTARFVPTADGTENLVKDGNFPAGSVAADGTNWGWKTGQYYSNSAGTSSVNGGKVTLNITTPGVDGANYPKFHPQLIQQGIALEQGFSYRLTFTASAGAPRTIDVGLQKGGPDDWDSYGENTFNLTTSEQQFELEFEMTEPSDGNVQLFFNVGGPGTAGTSVTISNVKLVYLAGEVTKTLNPVFAAKFQLYSLSNKMLRIESEANSAVYLYDIKGNLAQKIQVSKGSSIVQLSVPNGIYVAKHAKTGQMQTIMVKAP